METNINIPDLEVPQDKETSSSSTRKRNNDSQLSVVILLVAIIVILVGVGFIAHSINKNNKIVKDAFAEAAAKSQVTVGEADLYWHKDTFAVGEQKRWRTYGKKFTWNWGGYPDCFEVKNPHGKWVSFHDGNANFKTGEYTWFRRIPSCKHTKVHILQVWNSEFTETKITKNKKQ